MLWIPQTMEELIRTAQEQLKCSGTSILSEDGGRILDVDMISDKQKLYVVMDQDSTTEQLKYDHLITKTCMLVRSGCFFPVSSTHPMEKDLHKLRNAMKYILLYSITESL